MSTIVRLTARKREILELASKGKTDKQIAATLGISLGTVQSHWKDIRSLLGVVSRAEAIAQVVLREARDELNELERDRSELLDQLEDSSVKARSLEDQIRDLKDLVKRQAAFLSKSMSAMDRRVTAMSSRFEALERQNDLLLTQGVLVHSGEYGASWRKHVISDYIRITGVDPESWLSGETNLFDFLDARYLTRSLGNLEASSTGANRVIMTYRMNTPNGKRLFLEFSHCKAPQANGVGNYSGVAIDVTEWADLLEARIAEGWLQPIPEN